MRVCLRPFVLAGVLLTLAGCIVQSLNPYYTKGSLFMIPGVGGEWTLLDEKGDPQEGNPWVFGGDRIITYDKNGVPGSLKATYFRIGESFFLDTTAGDPGEESNKWWTIHLFPVHVVTRVEIHDDRLTLTPIDYDWIEKALRDGIVRLPHLRQKEDDSLLFTASSRQWMIFLKRFSHDVKVFSDKNAVRLVRSEGDKEKTPPE